MTHTLLPSHRDAQTGAGLSASARVLDLRQAEFLLQLLISNDPLQLHFEAPLWTPQALAEVVRDEFERALTGEEINRCLFELALMPPDLLLTIDPTLHGRCARWMASELPRRTAQGQATWCLAEHALSISDDSSAQGTPRQRAITVMSAISAAGQLAWWLCRGSADTRARIEFVSRLRRLSPGCAMLVSGLGEAYAEAIARLPPTDGDPILIDLRCELEAMQNGSSHALYRQEVFAARERRVEGEVLLLPPLPVRWMTGGVVLLMLVMLLASFGRYARTQAATGLLLPTTGVVRLQAPQSGVLKALEVGVGDRVGEGQALARIISSQMDADGVRVDARIVAELQQALKNLEDEEADLFKQNELERQRLGEALGAAQRQRRDLAEQHRLQNQRQQLLEDNLARSRRLAEDGVIARVQLQELEQQALAGKVQTLTLVRERDAASAAIGEARNRIAQQPLQASQLQDAIGQRRNELTQRLAQARLQVGATLRAPAAGRVAALLAQPGNPVSAGAPIMMLVDDRAALQAELFVPSRAIGFIRKGQQVKLKLDAFPYQKYGYQHGVVHEISATAVAARDLNAALALNEPAYVVRVALDAQSIRAYGVQHALNAGMQVQADIVIDRPRLIEWVFEPLLALRGH